MRMNERPRKFNIFNIFNILYSLVLSPIKVLARAEYRNSYGIDCHKTLLSTGYSSAQYMPWIWHYSSGSNRLGTAVNGGVATFLETVSLSLFTGSYA